MEFGDSTKTKPECKFGTECYRSNPSHLKEFSHPKRKSDESENGEKNKQQEEDLPPKKKQKINDFFKTKTSDKKVSQVEEVDVKSKIETRQNDEEKTTESSTVSPLSEPNPSDDELANISFDDDISASNLNSDVSPLPVMVPLPVSEAKTAIKYNYHMDMPEDFYDFWEFAIKIDKKNPQDAFLGPLGLRLVGPYDILAGRATSQSSQKDVCWARHWRYYYDPPEMMTTVSGDDVTQFHMGYYRDEPKDLPGFVASNSAKTNCTLASRGQNMFSAVNWFIDDSIKKDTSKRPVLASLKSSLVSYAQSHGHPLEMKTKSMKARDKQVNTKTFHSAGIVVPVDKNDVGYRELPETDADLKKMLKSIVEATSDDARNQAFDPLMEIIMLVQFANDECDYGEGLELGLDLFSYGNSLLHKTILNLLPLAYELLNRDLYTAIIRKHLEDRKHTAQLSQL